MAEAEQTEQNDKITPTPHRRPYYQNQNRPGTSYRGRGRANASVSKALHLFGVRDLREILDRKHHNEEEGKSGPPPDPSYNYLKDPSRENANEYHNTYYKERPSGVTFSRGHNFRGSRGRGRGSGSFRENRQQETEKSSFIQNPVNIKVELVASTGERNCHIDEETKIADIKRIPNYKLKDLRSRHEDVAGKDFNDKHRNERGGRGRGQRGRRSRGRSERGRGRGRGRYTNRNNENNHSQEQTTDENASKENQDKEYVGPTPVANEENYDEEGEHHGEGEIHEGENHEEDYTEDQEHEDGDQEQYYEGEEEYSEAIEHDQSLDEAAGQDDAKLEDNLVITSAQNEEKCKRTVKFKLDDKQSDQAVKQEIKNDKKSVEKEYSEKEQNKKPHK